MGMNPDRAVDVGGVFGHGAHAVKAPHAGTNGQEMTYAFRARAVEHGIQLGGEIRKIEMAMAVDKHEASLSD
jgi:hypothetical protein